MQLYGLQGQLTVAVIGGVEAHSVETLVPALDSLEILLPIRSVLASAISPVGTHTETLVLPSQSLTRKKHQGRRDGADRSEELHIEKIKV